MEEDDAEGSAPSGRATVEAERARAGVEISIDDVELVEVVCHRLAALAVSQKDRDDSQKNGSPALYTG